MKRSNGHIIPNNWNNCPELELNVWNRLTGNFWLPEKIAIGNDLPTWNGLDANMQELVLKVFSGLTLLDTIQGTVGMSRILPDSQNEFEEAIICNMQFMEQIHAKSYSSIFTTLSNTADINAAFAWSEANPYLQFKADTIIGHYDGDDPHKRKIASTMLEAALFYSGFGLPFYLSSRSLLPNTADIIRLILRDESIHAFIIGSWHQRNIAQLSAEQQQEYEDFAYDLVDELYQNEEKYTRSLYDEAGLTDTMLPFVRYNFNKALMNLGYSPLFSADQTQVAPSIMSSLSPNGDENHDFFSGGGSSYVQGKVEDLQDEDWGW